MVFYHMVNYDDHVALDISLMDDFSSRLDKVQMIFSPQKMIFVLVIEKSLGTFVISICDLVKCSSYIFGL